MKIIYFELFSLNFKELLVEKFGNLVTENFPVSNGIAEKLLCITITIKKR